MGSTREGSLAKNERELPDVAQVVVCGAGVVGASVAYHLSEVGFKNILLLEQGRWVLGGCVMSKYVWSPCYCFLCMTCQWLSSVSPRIDQLIECFVLEVVQLYSLF